jgi:hypothetical protein
VGAVEVLEVGLAVGPAVGPVVVVFKGAADVVVAAEVVALEVVGAADEVEEVELLQPVITRQQTKRITREMKTFFILTDSFNNKLIDASACLSLDYKRALIVYEFNAGIRIYRESRYII